MNRTLSLEKNIDWSIHSAQKAFSYWRELTTLKRFKILYRFHQLIAANIETFCSLIANIGEISAEEAKEALEIGLRGYEFPAEITLQITSEANEKPLGVCAGFLGEDVPPWIALFLFPVALIAGNTYVLMISQKWKEVGALFVSLSESVGIPPGVLNVIYGSEEEGIALSSHPQLALLSWCGPCAKHFIQANKVSFHQPRKECLVLMPDAHIESTKNLVESEVKLKGALHWRTLLSVIIVGDCTPWEDVLRPYLMIPKERKGYLSSKDWKALDHRIGVISKITARKVLNLEYAASLINSDLSIDGVIIATESGPTVDVFQKMMNKRHIGVNISPPLVFNRIAYYTEWQQLVIHWGK